MILETEHRSSMGAGPVLSLSLCKLQIKHCFTVEDRACMCQVKCLTSSPPSGDFLDPYSVEAVMSVPAAPATAVVSALPSEVRSLLPSDLLLSPDGLVILVTYDLQRCRLMSYRVRLANTGQVVSSKTLQRQLPASYLTSCPVTTLWMF